MADLYVRVYIKDDNYSLTFEHGKVESLLLQIKCLVFKYICIWLCQTNNIIFLFIEIINI